MSNSNISELSKKSMLHIYTRPPMVGLAFVFFLVLSPIVIGSRSLLAFFSLEGLLIVGGGVVAVAYMSFPVEDVRKALDAIKDLFSEQEPDLAQDELHGDMKDVIRWANMIKEKGVRNLEKLNGATLSDPFVKYGLNMVMGGYTPDEVRGMMETAADACYERDCVPVDILQSMTSHAPAFGMVGTLVGMVIMLCNLGGDVSNMSSTLAVSFLSTLYGVISARMLYIPAASKLKQKIDQRHFRNHLITEGMVMLVSGKAPMYVQDRLNSFLRPEMHDYFDVYRGDRPQIPTAAASAAATLAAMQAQLKAINA